MQNILCFDKGKIYKHYELVNWFSSKIFLLNNIQIHVVPNN